MKIEIEVDKDKTDVIIVIHAVLQKAEKLMKKSGTVDGYTRREIYALSAFANRLAEASNIKMERFPAFIDILTSIAKWKDAYELDVELDK